MEKVFYWYCRRFALLCVTFGFVLMATGVARANYVVTLTQQGSNVVASGSGMIDLTGLTFTGEYDSAPATLYPSLGYVNTGPTTSVVLDAYTGFTGPTSFGTGGFTAADSGSGDSVEIIGSSGTFGLPLLWVPAGYVSETALSDMATYDNTTFSSLGVTPGTYEWTWGSGTDQNFTLQIGSPTAAAEPSSSLLLGLALMACLWIGRKQIFARAAQV